MTGPVPPKRPDDGLRPERTAVSWSRTSLGFLSNGALLLFRDVHSGGPPRFVPTGFAVVVALCAHVIGARRQRVLGQRPLPKRISPRLEVRFFGSSVLILIVVTVVVLSV